jgi:hypothetical protein
MSANRVELVGWNELLIQLRSLPQAFADEAAEMIDNTVEEAASSLIQSYPIGPGSGRYRGGNLRKGVKWGTTRSGYGISGFVKSTAPHAWWWEHGTKPRKTNKGWPRGAARHHYNQGLVGIAIRKRRELRGKLIDVVRRAGFDVQDNG